MALKIGLVGCGNISDIYLTNARLFRDIEFAAVSDINPEAAARQGAKYGLPVRTVDALLASGDVDIVLNLTVPDAHAPVYRAAIEAGKHVYGEKPLATTLEDGRRVVEAARAKGLRIGSAPDTVLGGGIQTARALVDGGAIGKPLLGLMAVLSHGMENWHPNPAFFFKPGGGPVFDLGPYYISALVTLLGPVASVVAVGQIGFAERTVTTETSPVRGSKIKVEVLTTAQALLTFASGAQITFLASWDVWRHGVPPIEIHGTEGSMRVPDPNFFGGPVDVARERADWAATQTTDKTFGVPNWPAQTPTVANYRGLGLAEMARAIGEGRPHRANGDLALHVLAVMAGILDSAVSGKPVAITDGCERPAPLGEDEAKGLLAG